MTTLHSRSAHLAPLAWLAMLTPVLAQAPPEARPAGPAAAANAAAVARVKALAPRIEQNLRENVVPFWFPRSVDRVNGGFTVHFPAA
jgi:hypothetical protein